MGCTAVSLCTCALVSAVALAPALMQAGSPRGANPFLTLNVSTTGLGMRGADYRGVQCFYRVNPRGHSLSGFYLAGRGGLHHLSSKRTSGTFVGLGFELGYTWLLGSDRHISVTIGAGAMQLSGGTLSDISLFVPTVRLAHVSWQGPGLR